MTAKAAEKTSRGKLVRRGVVVRDTHETRRSEERRVGKEC